jgi:hypothetical protein
MLFIFSGFLLEVIQHEGTMMLGNEIDSGQQFAHGGALFFSSKTAENKFCYQS